MGVWGMLVGPVCTFDSVIRICKVAGIATFLK